MIRLRRTGFPHSDIPGSKLVYQLPWAYRRFPRPSSPLDAKTSTTCPCSLDRTDLRPITGNQKRLSFRQTADRHQSARPVVSQAGHDDSIDNPARREGRTSKLLQSSTRFDSAHALTCINQSSCICTCQRVTCDARSLDPMRRAALARWHTSIYRCGN